MTVRYTPVEMLERLVSFPTVSSDSNLDLIDFVGGYLAGHGVKPIRIPSSCGRKASLIASIGPDRPGGVLLSGHTDVVPVQGQAWTSDPWSLIERNGALYGRGTCDMKGFCAVALALVPQMIEAGLTRPVQIALSYDEEVGCLGAARLIPHLKEAFPKAEAVIVGEPTELSVVNGHKGTWSLVTRVQGYEVHSSRCHKGVSAVMAAARLVAWLDDRMRENAHCAETEGGHADFDPPYTTLHVGRIKGGTAGNITALKCTFPVDIRTIPSEDMDGWLSAYRTFARDLETDLKRVRPEASISIEVRARVASLAPEAGGRAEALTTRAAETNVIEKAAFGSEAGLFQEAGYSTVVCGPGAIEQAHQPDEFISCAQLAAGEAFIRNILDGLAVEA